MSCDQCSLFSQSLRLLLTDYNHPLIPTLFLILLLFFLPLLLSHILSLSADRASDLPLEHFFSFSLWIPTFLDCFCKLQIIVYLHLSATDDCMNMNWLQPKMDLLTISFHLLLLCFDPSAGTSLITGKMHTETQCSTKNMNSWFSCGCLWFSLGLPSLFSAGFLALEADKFESRGRQIKTLIVGFHNWLHLYLWVKIPIVRHETAHEEFTQHLCVFAWLQFSVSAGREKESHVTSWPTSLSSSGGSTSWRQILPADVMEGSCWAWSQRPSRSSSSSSSQSSAQPMETSGSVSSGTRGTRTAAQTVPHSTTG